MQDSSHSRLKSVAIKRNQVCDELLVASALLQGDQAVGCDDRLQIMNGLVKIVIDNHVIKIGKMTHILHCTA